MHSRPAYSRSAGIREHCLGVRCVDYGRGDITAQGRKHRRRDVSGLSKSRAFRASTYCIVQQRSHLGCAVAVPAVTITDIHLLLIFCVDRCSITLGLIRSTALRTCITCSRKALVGRAPADTEAEDANGMEVDGSPATADDLLRGLPKCVWCGGLFVTLR